MIVLYVEQLLAAHHTRAVIRVSKSRAIRTSRTCRNVMERASVLDISGELPRNHTCFQRAASLLTLNS